MMEVVREINIGERSGQSGPEVTKHSSLKVADLNSHHAPIEGVCKLQVLIPSQYVQTQ